MGLVFLAPVLWSGRRIAFGHAQWNPCALFVHLWSLIPINIPAVAGQRVSVPHGGRQKCTPPPSRPHSRPAQLFLPTCVNGSSSLSLGRTVEAEMRAAGEGKQGMSYFVSGEARVPMSLELPRRFSCPARPESHIILSQRDWKEQELGLVFQYVLGRPTFAPARILN